MTTPVPQGKAPRRWLTRLSAISDMFAFPLRTSHYVELVNPLWTTHRMHARVVDVWDETRDARTVTLKPGSNWRLHRPGQHIRVGIPVDGRHYTRTYTISSPPERDDGCFTITVKKIDGGRLSHHIVRNLKVGDFIPVGLPQGEFYLPDASPVQPLFITAGSGITPAMSMVRSLIAQERLPDTVHIHYAPHEFDTIFGRELRRLDQEQAHYHLHEVHTRQAPEDQNHFTEAQLERLCPDWRERDCYACGPPALLAALERTWEEAGLSQRLHIERFRADFAPIPDDAVGGRVRFADSDLDVDADGETNLLRVAEDAGLNPPHGCRMGICHTCNTTLQSGCVRDLRSGDFINEPGAIVQVCVCAAAGDCELAL
ncbi:ferredoxin reductase [Alloalcanivorax gelatiniphagus]|uniref:Ferredoxin reductase n=1 Tax=Alloalcanivorax gelatiniphagus TaxID=1194167 RepID=A0ABY2XHA8_9GAMM|nr:ferredoxin reductase [Alloalcanivorax gelatiniphagus]TMW11069.1 ferredoxin reductase [Alloalcanivorax gelatiniphagus]|tara:strand:- start:22995 stop:24107 length:1113 start_codon:yes stop_codon:yes gene_type:complete